jgi:hypothetical protein
MTRPDLRIRPRFIADEAGSGCDNSSVVAAESGDSGVTDYTGVTASIDVTAYAGAAFKAGRAIAMATILPINKKTPHLIDASQFGFPVRM